MTPTRAPAMETGQFTTADLDDDLAVNWRFCAQT